MALLSLLELFALFFYEFVENAFVEVVDSHLTLDGGEGVGGFGASDLRASYT